MRSHFWKKLHKIHHRQRKINEICAQRFSRWIKFNLFLFTYFQQSALGTACAFTIKTPVLNTYFLEQKTKKLRFVEHLILISLGKKIGWTPRLHFALAFWYETKTTNEKHNKTCRLSNRLLQDQSPMIEFNFDNLIDSFWSFAIQFI